MIAPGDFIGPYRVLAEVSRRASSVTYLVEHPAQGPAAPTFLTVWPDVHLRSAEEKRAFTEACQEIARSQAAAFPLLGSGLEQEAPYIVLSEHEESLEGIALLDQRLQNRAETTPAASVEASAETTHAGPVVMNAEVVPPASAQAAPEPPKPTGVLARVRAGVQVGKSKLSTRHGRIWAGVFAALLVILVGTSVLYLVVPASGATVTLTPRSVQRQDALSVVVFTQPNQGGDIQGRSISYTTSTQTGSGPATGVAHQAATKATGHVVISNISLNTSGPVQVGSSTITSNSGVNIIVGGFYTIPVLHGESYTVAAHAEQAGSNGNIPAYDIDFPVNLCRSSDVLCANPIGSAYIQNPQPFTGGSDAYDQPVVQQSDIDAAASPLIDQLTSSAQASVAQLVAQQMQPGEQTALTAPECTPNVQANHQVGDFADSVTVQVNVTCYQITYAQQDFIPGVIHAEQQVVDGVYGPGVYRLTGDLLAGPPMFDRTIASLQTAYLRVNAKSIWVYQVDAAHRARIAQQIAGQAPSDARKLVLHLYAGIQDVTAALQGVGSKLPTDAGAIHVIVQAVPGLHA